MNSEQLRDLEYTIGLLRESLRLYLYESIPGSFFIQVRDACIQRFEYCYELSTRLLRDHMQSMDAMPKAIQAMPFSELIEEAYRLSLVQRGWNQWSLYRSCYADSPLAYRDTIAEKVITELPDFLTELEYLYRSLQQAHEV